MNLSFDKKMDILESIAEGLYYEKDPQIIEKIMAFIDNSEFREEFIKGNYRVEKIDDENFSKCVKFYVDSYKTFWDEMEENNNNSSEGGYLKFEREYNEFLDKEEMGLPF